MVRATPKAFAVSAPGMKVTILEQSKGHAKLEFLGVYCFLEVYTRGVLEGVVWCHGHEPSVTVTPHAHPWDAVIAVSWT
jgi:hypothetical protein